MRSNLPRSGKFDLLGLESPQIPQLLAYLERNKRLYLVQEFIDGQNLLKELVKEGLKTGMAISTFEGHKGGIYEIGFSQDGKTLVSGSEDGTIKLWQPNKGREICTILANTPCVYAAAISPDGKYIAGGSEDGTINIWQRD